MHDDHFLKKVIVNIREMLLWVQHVPGGPHKHEYMYTTRGLVDTNTHTHTYMYSLYRNSDFLVVTTSVGLAQARHNNCINQYANIIVVLSPCTV